MPLVPAVSATLWNRVNVTPRIGIAAGVIHQTKIYAAIDNQVTLYRHELDWWRLLTRFASDLADLERVTGQEVLR